MTSLKKGNALLKDGKYHEAIQFYKLISEKNAALKELAEFNIKICKKRLEKKEISSIEKTINKISIPSEKDKKNCSYRLDNVNHKFAQGWAIDQEIPDNNVIIQILIDDTPYSVIETCTRRDDVQKHFGGNGYSGFRAELNEYTTYEKSTLSSIPLSHNAESNDLKKAKKIITPLLKGTHFKNINKIAEQTIKKYIHIPSNTEKANENKKTSVIILNLNGEKVIERCLRSVIKHHGASEIIVIDHGSNDNSIKIIKGINSNKIKLIERNKNYSYSASNNLGAHQASGDILIFMNNDIVLESNSISSMSEIIKNEEFGLLGIKLWDYPESDQYQLDSDIRINQHLGVHFRGTQRAETIDAFELRSSVFIKLEKGILETPAVTAAMMAIKKEDFIELGGFDESYFYGQEDVDFCLRFRKKINKKTGTLLDHGAYHIRGLTRKDLSKTNKNYISNNKKIIQKKLGKWLRKELRVGQFEKPGFWNQKPLSISMVVSEIGFNTDKADFFTAKELGDAFEKKENTVVGYFDINSDYDVSGYDIVIVFIDSFDPRKLKNISPHTVVIGWARNWFDRWCNRAWIESYDILYASSEFAQKYMEERLRRKVGLLRIAASNACVNIQKTNNKSDYVFTGSYFNSPREIEEALDPKSIPFTFKLYGHNWEKTNKFSEYTCGPVSYDKIPNIYSSTQLVIDDSNIATKDWGALNCRVYDAFAAGTLCITNNSIGIQEIFNKTPIVYTKENLNEKVNEYLLNPLKNESLAKEYQKEILLNHTYENRVEQINHDIQHYLKKTKISIKIAPPDFERGITWGDYHFATSLRQELEKLEYTVRIDCLDSWYSSRSLNDDINLVLRGLERFKVREDQVNIMWLISHPDLVCEQELRDFNKIFVASDYYTEKLIQFTGINNIESLLQASAFDIDTFDPKIYADIPEHDILFIGNSRNEYRNVVRWCVDEKIPISLYGKGWENFIPKEYIKGEFIPNELISYYYNKSKIVLNDHWEDMRRNGFISNRVFDVISSNSLVITDAVKGIEKIEKKTNQVITYNNKKDFLQKIKANLNISNKTHQLNKFERTLSSFENRALTIKSFIENGNPKTEISHNHKIQLYLKFSSIDDCIDLVIQRWNEYKKNKRSFSLIRLGDGENSILKYPENCSFARIQHVFRRAMLDRTYTDSEISKIKLLIKNSVNNSDVLGMYDSYEQNEHCVIYKEDIHDELYPPAFICNPNIHLALQCFGVLKELIKDADKVTLITGRDPLKNFHSVFPSIETELISIPVERQYKTKKEKISLEQHFPDRFNSVINEIKVANDKNHLFLVGAGFLGKIYCDKIKSEGGFALDIGSVLDYWAEVPTREGKKVVENEEIVHNEKSRWPGISLDEPAKKDDFTKKFRSIFRPMKITSR